MLITTILLLLAFPGSVWADPIPCVTPATCPKPLTDTCEFYPPATSKVCKDSTGKIYGVASPTPKPCDPATTADTALGCIPTAPGELVQWILKYAILMGGGIAFLLSVWGGATILLSAGNPEKINEGREIIVSAISGLLFIVLSIFLLRLIGVDILGIPGFKRI